MPAASVPPTTVGTTMQRVQQHSGTAVQRRRSGGMAGGTLAGGSRGVCSLDLISVATDLLLGEG